MKRYTIAVVGMFVVVSFCLASCGAHKKTLGCPGMITKATPTSKVIHS